MKLKASVMMQGVKPELLLILPIVSNILDDITGEETVVTSLVDGKHKRQSEHYQGNAADFRVWGLFRMFADPDSGYDPQKLENATKRLSEALGPNYFFQFEKDHLHVQYDPMQITVG